MSPPVRRWLARMRSSPPGSRVVSASTKTRVSPVAACAPCQQAQGLPSQSIGSAGAGITIAPASRARRAVRSSEWSSTTMISPGVRLWELRQASSSGSERSSLRAGTMIDTTGPVTAGSSPSSRRGSGTRHTNTNPRLQSRSRTSRRAAIMVRPEYRRRSRRSREASRPVSSPQVRTSGACAGLPGDCPKGRLARSADSPDLCRRTYSRPSRVR